ncbi:magnesium transporter [Symbiobacterium terraclitae]|uniref:Magnesium transporter MgtE n=1 Tax=Symbiobacterium terraclitae TaxID=557451 RepID=A0ABS4JP60_9FIRM|nr:magnesium transporter [Symbiobacterium terraclitae]
MNQELIGILDQTIVMLQQHREDELRTLLDELHPADLAELLEELEDEQRAAVVQLMSGPTAAEAIAELELEEQAAIVTALPPEKAKAILDEMSADDAADLFAELEPEDAGSLLQLMTQEDATDVRELMTFPEDTAGGIMTTEFVAIGAQRTAADAIDELRRAAPSAETAYYVYVVDEQGRLVGVLSLRELIVAQPDAEIRSIMRTNVVSVHVNDDQEEVARTVQKYNLLAVPVVDDQDVLRGIVTVDDVIDVLEEEATEDIFRAGGVSDAEQQLDLEGPIWPAIRARLPWLLGLLFLSLVSGKVIEGFTPLMDRVTALAIFITTMAGGAGNAATQALTVVVRGLATGEMERDQVGRVVWREARIGIVIGAICGLVLGVTAMVWNHSPWIGLIVGLSIAINLMLAKAAGSLVPVIIQRLGLDPAVASGPFIATITDTTSMLVYFSIAALILGAVL